MPRTGRRARWPNTPGWAGHRGADLGGAEAAALAGRDLQGLQRRELEAKLVDVVGLYLNPPERAVVLCFDEKSQCQALERTQPSLPLTPGRAGTMTHDYKRHGTTTLFATLDIATGQVMNHCFARHRNREFLAFLKIIDGQVPRDLDVHLVLDNYAVHKHPAIKEWLAKPRQRRWHLHFTPTSSSWLKSPTTRPSTSAARCPRPLPHPGNGDSFSRPLGPGGPTRRVIRSASVCQGVSSLHGVVRS